MLLFKSIGIELNVKEMYGYHIRKALEMSRFPNRSYDFYIETLKKTDCWSVSITRPSYSQPQSYLARMQTFIFEYICTSYTELGCANKVDIPGNRPLNVFLLCLNEVQPVQTGK